MPPQMPVRPLTSKWSAFVLNLGLVFRKETPFVYQTNGVSFQRNKSLAGFVKYASRVKYCFAM